MKSELIFFEIFSNAGVRQGFAQIPAPRARVDRFAGGVNLTSPHKRRSMELPASDSEGGQGVHVGGFDKCKTLSMGPARQVSQWYIYVCTHWLSFTLSVGPARQVSQWYIYVCTMTFIYVYTIAAYVYTITMNKGFICMSYISYICICGYMYMSLWYICTRASYVCHIYDIYVYVDTYV